MFLARIETSRVHHFIRFNEVLDYSRCYFFLFWKREKFTERNLDLHVNRVNDATPNDAQHLPSSKIMKFLIEEF